MERLNNKLETFESYTSAIQEKKSRKKRTKRKSKSKTKSQSSVKSSVWPVYTGVWGGGVADQNLGYVDSFSSFSGGDFSSGDMGGGDSGGGDGGGGGE